MRRMLIEDLYAVCTCKPYSEGNSTQSHTDPPAHQRMAPTQDLETLAGATLSATITGLSSDLEYDFRVFSGSFKGYETVGSNVVRRVQPIGVPTRLSIRGVSRDSATLDWLPPTQGRNPAFYRIQ